MKRPVQLAVKNMQDIDVQFTLFKSVKKRHLPHIIQLVF